MLAIGGALKGMVGRGHTPIYFLISQLSAILFFAILYWVFEQLEPGLHFKGTRNTHDINSFLDLFYYSMVTQTTVGYGDIVPVSKLARVGAICQMLLVYVGLGLTEGKILKAIGF